MSSRPQQSAPSITFLSRMGASTRGIVLGSPHSSVRLHTLVWPQSPPLRRGSPDSSKQCFKGFCATTETVLPPSQRGDRGSPSIGPITRLFQPLFPFTEEGRRCTTHSRSVLSEPLPLQREDQDVDVEDYYVSDSSGRLVCHGRPEICLFTHSSCPAAQEVPLFRFWREGLSIQISSLWPGFGAKDIHKMHGCCPGPLEALGHSCTQLPGWLAHSGPLQGISELSQGCCPPPRSCSWSQNKHQEECSLPLSTNCVFVSSLGFLSNTGPSGSCPDFQPQCLSSLTCAAPGVTLHEAVPLVDKSSRAPLHKTSRSPNQCVAKLLSHPFNMAKPPFYPEWSQNGRDSPSPNGYDGCIPDRLGRGLRGRENSSLGT